MSNYSYFSDTMEYIFEGQEKTVIEIEAFINNKIEVSKTKIKSSLDFKTFLAFSSVLKSSSHFWLDESLGGLGKFNQYKAFEKNNISAKSGWRDCARDVLASDAAAGAGFQIAGIFAIIEGIACPWCMLGKIALASGFASGWAYYQSDDC